MSISSILDKLKGKKTLIVSITGAITAVGGYLTGDLSVTQLIMALFAAAGAAAGRSALATETDKKIAALDEMAAQLQELKAKK